MSYQRSKQHLVNINNARKFAQKTQPCKFCNILRNRANIAKHENSCYLNPKNQVLCAICSTPIKLYKTAKTCSHSCSNKYFRTGPSNGNWKDDAYVTTCFHYHKKQCVICNETNIVTVHHLDENHQNNNPANLIPLCPTHHQYWHSRYKPLIENRVLQYINNWKKHSDI